MENARFGSLPRWAKQSRWLTLPCSSDPVSLALDLRTVHECLPVSAVHGVCAVGEGSTTEVSYCTYCTVRSLSEHPLTLFRLYL